MNKHELFLPIPIFYLAFPTFEDQGFFYRFFNL